MYKNASAAALGKKPLLLHGKKMMIASFQAHKQPHPSLILLSHQHTNQMESLERASPALKQILLRIHRQEKPTEVDHHWHELQSIHYHVQHSVADPFYTYLSISTPLSHGVAVNMMSIVNGICPGVMEAAEEPNEGFNLTLKINLSRIPSSAKESIRVITSISSVHACLLISHMKEQLVNKVDAISWMPMKPVKLVYYKKEPFFIVKQPGKIIVVYPMRFKEIEDVVIASAFFESLTEVSNLKAYKKAPLCSWSPIPPKELRGEHIEDLCTNSGFISFDVMASHLKAKKVDKVIWSLLNFQTFVKCHVKTTKSFILRRMRTRLRDLAQKTGIDAEPKTQTPAKLFVGKQ